MPVLIVAALALALGTLLGRTQWGRWIYAVGGNPDGARRAGIPADGVLLSVYALCGLLAGHRRASSSPGAPTRRRRRRASCWSSTRSRP